MSRAELDPSFSDVKKTLDWLVSSTVPAATKRAAIAKAVQLAISVSFYRTEKPVSPHTILLRHLVDACSELASSASGKLRGEQSEWVGDVPEVSRKEKLLCGMK